MTNNPLIGFPQYLIQKNHLSEKLSLQLLNDAKNANKSYITYLYETQHITSQVLKSAITTFFGLQNYNFNDKALCEVTFDPIAQEIIVRYKVIPIKQNPYVLIISDPTDMRTIENCQFLLGSHINLMIASPYEITDFIEKNSQKLDHQIRNQVEQQIASRHTLMNEVVVTLNNDTPIIKLLYKYIHVAIQKNASDIHFEPYENAYRIRARIDGVLYIIFEDTIKISQPMITAIKVMARMNIAEKRAPQDGRFEITPEHNRTVEFRVSTCPTLFGEKIVLRLQEKKESIKKVSELGLSSQQEKILMHAISQPQGLILVTGPTGSGKSITLYALLQHLNKIENNIHTIEDPIEIQLNGINQAAVNVKSGLTFANALKAFLRQDPDIMMVGEIRDKETAEIAIRAAQTGHLVLSTLHTNSAVETVTRLLNLGISPDNLASALKLIVAQRLIRLTCQQCQRHLDQDFIKNICEYCHQGYKGRVGIFELLPISDALKQLILNKADTISLKKRARTEGMQTLAESAAEVLRQKRTTKEEILANVIDEELNV